MRTELNATRYHASRSDRCHAQWRPSSRTRLLRLAGGKGRVLRGGAVGGGVGGAVGGEEAGGGLVGEVEGLAGDDAEGQGGEWRW